MRTSSTLRGGRNFILLEDDDGDLETYAPVVSEGLERVNLVNDPVARGHHRVHPYSYVVDVDVHMLRANENEGCALYPLPLTRPGDLRRAKKRQQESSESITPTASTILVVSTETQAESSTTAVSVPTPPSLILSSASESDSILPTTIQTSPSSTSTDVSTSEISTSPSSSVSSISIPSPSSISISSISPSVSLPISPSLISSSISISVFPTTMTSIPTLSLSSISVSSISLSVSLPLSSSFLSLPTSLASSSLSLSPSLSSSSSSLSIPSSSSVMTSSSTSPSSSIISSSTIVSSASIISTTSIVTTSIILSSTASSSPLSTSTSFSLTVSSIVSSLSSSILRSSSDSTSLSTSPSSSRASSSIASSSSALPASSSSIASSLTSSSSIVPPPPSTSFASTSIIPTISSASSGSTFVSVPSSSHSSPSSSVVNPSSSSTRGRSQTVFTSTAVTTLFRTTTLPGGQTSTIVTVITSGVLRTNSPGQNGSAFARNTGAIIGVSVAGAFALIAGTVIIFFACRYRRKKRKSRGNPAYATAAGQSWSPPLINDGDEYPGNRYGSILAALGPPPENEAQKMDAGNEGAVENTSLGHGGGSVESGEFPRRSQSYSGQASIPGAAQAGAIASGSGEPTDVSPTLSRPPLTPHRPLFRHTSSGPEPGFWLGGREFNQRDNLSTGHSASGMSSSHGHSSGHEGRSPGSFGVAGSSSQGHDMTSSSSGHALLSSGARSSSDLMRPPLPHMQTPPSSYAFREQHTEQKVDTTEKGGSDSNSIRGFFGRLRGGRGSVSNVVIPHDMSMSPSHSKEALASQARYSQPPVRSPSSLLNPGPPSRPPSSAQMHSMELGPLSAFDERSAISGGRPGSEMMTLPPLPSSSMDEQRAPEGLLHPRLTRPPMVGQDSSTSLRDNLDYSRPIGGLVNNRMYSTTTFGTQDTDDTADRRTIESS